MTDPSAAKAPRAGRREWIGLAVIAASVRALLDGPDGSEPRRAFPHRRPQAQQNQGLYNGFLAAGLLRGLSRGTEGRAVVVFFLTCIIIAGVFGALTANRKILYVQALPAALTLILAILGTR